MEGHRSAWKGTGAQGGGAEPVGDKRGGGGAERARTPMCPKSRGQACWLPLYGVSGRLADCVACPLGECEGVGGVGGGLEGWRSVWRGSGGHGEDSEAGDVSAG